MNDLWRSEISTDPNTSMPVAVHTLLEATGELPAKRFGHSANIVGDRMIVIGGQSGTDQFNDVWSLAIDGLAWSAVATEGVAPSPRSRHSASLVEMVPLPDRAQPITSYSAGRSTPPSQTKAQTTPSFLQVGSKLLLLGGFNRTDRAMAGGKGSLPDKAAHPPFSCRRQRLPGKAAQPPFACRCALAHVERRQQRQLVRV